MSSSHVSIAPPPGLHATAPPNANISRRPGMTARLSYVGPELGRPSAGGVTPPDANISRRPGMNVRLSYVWREFGRPSASVVTLHESGFEVGGLGSVSKNECPARTSSAYTALPQ